jgi:Domain of unknown function (DUF4157)
MHPVAALSNTFGNSTLQRWMATSGIQAKLHVTDAGDKHEKEADNVASKVMRAPADQQPVDEPISRVSGGPAQRLTGSPLLHHPEPLDESRPGSPLIQREAADKEPVQKKTDEPISRVSGGPAQRLTGSPLLHHPEPLDETHPGSPLIQREAADKEPVQKADDETVQSKAEDEPLQKADDEAVQSKAENEPVQKADDETVQSKAVDEPVQKADDEAVQSKSEDEPVQKVEDEAVQSKFEDEPVQKADDEAVQSKAEDEPLQKADDETVQTKGASRAPGIPGGFAGRLQASRGEGRPLPGAARSFFEPRIGADFGSVRVHADHRGAELSRSIHAKAFTRGNHIYFAEGQYNPDTTSGRTLLAHELTHVVQQGHASAQKPSSAAPIQRAPEEEGRAVTDEQRAQALAAAARAAKIAGMARSFGKEETAKSKQEKAVKAAAEQNAKQKAKQHVPGKKAVVGGKRKPAGKGGGLLLLAGPVGKAPAGKAPRSPQEDPAFQAVVKRTAVTAQKQKSHAPAASKAGAAQAAAVMPPEQAMGTAQGAQTTAMQNAPTPGFNAAGFKAQLRKRIEEMTPKTTAEADEFKSNNQLGSVKQEMSGQVSQERDKAAGPLEEKKDQPPDVKSVPPKPVTPLTGPDASPAPGNLGAQGAAPKPKTTAEVEAPIQENTKRISDEMAKEKITDEQLAKSNEPKFQQALDAKQTAEKAAQTGPTQARAAEKAQIGKAEAQATAAAGSRVTAMQAGRAQITAAVAGQQTQTKTKDETARREVGQKIQGIYDKTKAEVDKILGALDGKVEKAFDDGAAAARKAFEDFVAAKMDAYKEDRYGGWFGWARWAKDKIAGMPSEVNAFYTEGRNLYMAKMDVVIDSVVAIIGSELAAAKAEIAKGRKEIADYLNTLPGDLKKVGAEAAEDIQSKFDSLEEGVNNKANELVDTLANKYIENLKAIDDRIEELKAANQGLVDAAIGAIKGVIEAIIALKNLFMRVLAKIIAVVSDIIADPIGFLKNLIAAIKLGLENFASNILTHLKTGFITWLTGALGPMNIKMPDDVFSLPGIFSLVTQLLGLTWEYLRAKAVKLLGEPVVKALEIGFDLFKIFMKDGVAGLWNYAKEKFSDLKEMIIEQIKNMLITQVIKAGIKWLMGLLNPVAAFIKAAMAIYDIVMFFMEKAKQVLELIEAFVDGVAAVAKGSIGGAAKLVEDALAKALPLVIGFLANLLGIGGLAEKVQKLFMSIRGRLDKFIDGIILKAKAWAGKFIGKIKGADRSPEQKQKDLSGGMAAAKSVMKRFSGRAVGLAVARPLLAAIRLRYRLTSLELEPAGENWAIKAVINPTLIENTDAKQDKGDGGRQVKSPATVKAALAALSAITKPDEVNPAMVELASQPGNEGILERYKTQDPEFSYVIYLDRIKNGEEFDPPLTYLRRRASFKRGKTTEKNWAQEAYPGGGSKIYKVKPARNRKAETVIPDIVTGSVIADVKNVKYQDFDAQLRAFEKIAHADRYTGMVFESDETTPVTTSRKFGLIYRSKKHSEKKTVLSGPLEAALDEHKDIIVD